MQSHEYRYYWEIAAVIDCHTMFTAKDSLEARTNEVRLGHADEARAHNVRWVMPDELHSSSEVKLDEVPTVQ